MSQDYVLAVLIICAAGFVTSEVAHGADLDPRAPVGTSPAGISSSDSYVEPLQPPKVYLPYVSVRGPKSNVMVFAYVPIASVESDGAKTSYPGGRWGEIEISANGAVTLTDGTIMKFGEGVEINGKRFSAPLLTIEPGGQVIEGARPIFEGRLGGDDPFSSIHAVQANILVYLYAQVSTIQTPTGVEHYDAYLWGKRIDSQAKVILNNGLKVTIGDKVHVGDQELRGFDDPAKGVRRFAILSPQESRGGPLRVREDAQASWVENVTYARMWSLEQRIRTYVIAYGRLPKAISELPVSTTLTNDTRDQWGGEIIYDVKDDTTVALVSYGRYGRHKGANPFIQRIVYLKTANK